MWYIQLIMIVYVCYDVFVIVGKCFSFLGFPFGRECYVIALNPDLLCSIFRILDLFAFTQRARSAEHFCSSCNLARNLLQIAGVLYVFKFAYN